MSSGAIVYVGADDNHRIPILQNAGYDVACCDSLRQLEIIVTTTRTDAVLLSEVEGVTSSVLTAVRQWSPAPLIIFATDLSGQAEERFDLVIEHFTPPAVWLNAIRQLIEDSCKSRAASALTRQESEKLRAESAELRRKLRSELKRSTDLISGEDTKQ